MPYLEDGETCYTEQELWAMPYKDLLREVSVVRGEQDLLRRLGFKAYDTYVASVEPDPDAEEVLS